MERQRHLYTEIRSCADCGVEIEVEMEGLIARYFYGIFCDDCANNRRVMVDIEASQQKDMIRECKQLIGDYRIAVGRGEV